MMLVLGQVPDWLVMLLVILFMGVCVLMILTVLIQKPQGGGLAGAFGSGAGSGQTAFGAKTGDALTIATIIMFCIFVLGAVGLNYLTRPPSGTATPTNLPGTGAGTEQTPTGAGETEPSNETNEPAPGETPPGPAETPEEPPAEPPVELPAEPPGVQNPPEPAPETPTPPPG